MMHNMTQDKSKQGKAENMVPRDKTATLTEEKDHFGGEKCVKKVTIFCKNYLIPRKNGPFVLYSPYVCCTALRHH
jgi:hypothetical protein